jgi:murein DD-endopeptidase MepM/ murein hydrolase activator NlpD
LDFDLKTNDTICSATDGFVVGVVSKYKYGGKGEEWKPFANFSTIYEPSSGVFTQYNHLVENGSLVKVGDKIVRGQKIALSGNTGLSTEEHLHFSCLIPVNSEDGLKSIPIEFVGGIKGINLKKGDELKK